MRPTRTKTILNGDEIVEVISLNVTWDIIRGIREKELKDSDWRFMSDQTPSQKWIDYRQFLRNLPENHFDESDEVSQGANAAADAWNEYEKPEGE
jgi:hypothetical protein